LWGHWCTTGFTENQIIKWMDQVHLHKKNVRVLKRWIVHMILAFLSSGSISCCRVSVEDRIKQLYSFVPFAKSRTCWVCGRFRGSARPRAVCQKHRSNRSCDVVRARLQRDVDALAPSVTVARREISVYPSADSPAVSSAFSEKNHSFGDKLRARRTVSIIFIN